MLCLNIESVIERVICNSCDEYIAPPCPLLEIAELFWKEEFFMVRIEFNTKIAPPLEAEQLKK
jgi:hypothetical protein